MLKALAGTDLLHLLNYRGTLSTYLDTFFSAWIDKQKDGIMHFTWNQVRNQESEKGGFMGTRTGRLSSQPSFLNVPGSPPEFPSHLGLPPLPKMRGYLIPDKGMYWLKRDYASQEIRVLAHYEDGTLMLRFQEMPTLDMHEFMSKLLTANLGREVTRKAAKTIAFAILYGMGLATMAERLGCSYDEAAFIKRAYMKALPGIKSVTLAIKQKWDMGEPFLTWGGRAYHKEESKLIVDKRTGEERMADFTYKGLNYLIQGSSADITKQAILNYDSVRRDGRFLLSVHDEISISGTPPEMRLLNEAMLDINLDVPLISDGFIGDNYGELRAFEEIAH
jgi:DNA polymerase I-like protein with 3'-5' exonuclease and polymerase domains